jgi:hypothetical protein
MFATPSLGAPYLSLVLDEIVSCLDTLYKAFVI